MTMTLRDEQISENVIYLVGFGLLATTQASNARPWPHGHDQRLHARS